MIHGYGVGQVRLKLCRLEATENRQAWVRDVGRAAPDPVIVSL
jgi:hypothetical protein